MDMNLGSRGNLPFVLRNTEVFIGYSHLGTCREFIWEGGFKPETGFQPSTFKLRGLKCNQNLDGLMLRDDLFLHTPENREYLLSNFVITDVTQKEEIKGMASGFRLLINEFPETKNSSGGEKGIITKSTQLQAFRAVSELIGGATSKSGMDTRIANGVIDQLAKEITHNPDAVINLLAIKSYDDYTFTHNINVATLSLVIGHAVGLAADDLQELGMGALLHDLGKIKISAQLLNKEGKLTDSEFNQIAQHPILGLELIGKAQEISIKARQVISQHHEKFLGHGYPFGSSGDRISFLARICSIADVFDALTTNRPFRVALPPYQAIRTMISMVESHFDPELLSIFLKKVSLYPPGSIVILNDGSKGLVLKSNPGDLMRPVVRILADLNEAEEQVDLSKDRSRYIKSTEPIPPLKPGIVKSK